MTEEETEEPQAARISTVSEEESGVKETPFFEWTRVDEQPRLFALEVKLWGGGGGMRWDGTVQPVSR